MPKCAVTFRPWRSDKISFLDAGFVPLLFILISIWGLTSCTNTKVHLFTEGLTLEQIENIEFNLSNSNYNTVRNSLPVPVGIKRPTLVYSPFHRDLKQVEELRDLLFELGYELDMEPVSMSNHYYTSSNVGVYPKAYNEDALYRLALSGKELLGKCSDNDANLTLVADHSFLLEIIAWDDVEGTELRSTKTGSWRRDGSMVFLQIDSARIPFKLSYIKTETEYAKVDGIKLTNVDGDATLALCDFSYVELDPL